DELAVDVKLRNRRPVRVLLDPLAHLGIRQHVEGVELDAVLLEDVDHGRRKPALRKALVALHEEHDLVALDELLDELRRVGIRHVRPVLRASAARRLRAACARGDVGVDLRQPTAEARPPSPLDPCLAARATVGSWWSTTLWRA